MTNLYLRGTLPIMKQRIIAGVFVGLAYALAVFLSSGLALICYSELCNLYRPGSVVTTLTGWWGLAIEFFLGGTASLACCLGGLLLFIIAAIKSPLLFENKVRFVVRWGFFTSMLSFVWTFIVRFVACDPLMVLILTIFTWFFVRHIRAKDKIETPR